MGERNGESVVIMNEADECEVDDNSYDPRSLYISRSSFLSFIFSDLLSRLPFGFADLALFL